MTANGEFINIVFTYDQSNGVYSIWINGENIVFNLPYPYDNGKPTGIHAQVTKVDCNLMVNNFIITSYN